MRDVSYACRAFARAPVTALTIIVTVALGLGLVAAVFTILNAIVFRVDDVRNPHELFAVERQPSANAEPEVFTRADYEALVRETAFFSDAFATTPDVQAWIEGARREGALVTGNFFQVLGVGAARGRVFTPADDAPGAPPVIVLSHRAWLQHFASDPGVVGRTLRVNGTPFDVVGVMPEGFRGLIPIAAPDFWAPLSLVDAFRPDVERREEPVGLGVVGRLAPGVERSEALAQLIAWDARRMAERPRERPATSLRLEPRPGTIPLTPDVMLLFMPLFFAFGLILVIGCANVANLLLARAVARGREIGIRLAIGASRGRIVSQLLTESLVLALVAAALAYGISRLVIVGVVRAITTTFPPEIGNLRLEAPSGDWRIALFLLAGALLSTLFFALAPALQATRPELVRAIHGEIFGDARPARARNALVALQVAGSVLLLICAAVFLRSTWASASVEPNIRTAGIVNVEILDEQRRGTILSIVESEPLIASVAASWPGGLGGLGGVPASVEGAAVGTSVTYQLVSPEYFDALGIDLVRGRGFTVSERDPSAAVAVVSESTAAELWPGRDALGQVVRIEPDAPSGVGRPNSPLLAPRTAVVVGVVREVQGLRFLGMGLGATGIYMPISADAAATTLTAVVRGDAEQARRALIDRMAVTDPNMAEVSTLQTIARAEAYLLAIPFWLTFALGTLALLLMLSGLFSVLSYLVEQRAREMGVRTALGATKARIAALVLSQSVRPVAVGALVGTSLTAALGAALLATPAAEQIGSVVRLFDPFAYVAGLVCVLAACVGAALVPALRAGRVDPVAALRQD